MSQRNPIRTLFTVLMDILVVIAIVVTLRIVVVFFGQLASQGWAETIVALTNPVTVPLGIEAVKTPYGGVFDIDAAATVGIVLVLEWMLSTIKSRV